MYPILHNSLSDETLAKIKAIYDQFRGIIPMTLEQFELGFMQDREPLLEIQMWEMIVSCFQKARKCFADTYEQQVWIYQTILYLLIGDIENNEDVSVVRHCFSEAFQVPLPQGKGIVAD